MQQRVKDNSGTSDTVAKMRSKDTVKTMRSKAIEATM